MDRPTSKTTECRSDSNDWRLVERLKERSASAFEELVDTHARRLYSVAMTILHNTQDAEDCVQETFLKVIRSISSYRGQASLSTWLYRIVTNQALMNLRSQRRNPVVAVESYLPRFEQGRHATEIQDWGQRPDRALQTRELTEKLEKFIDELPEHYRVPYILKDMEELSEAEVSETLGLPKTTIKNRVHRARLVIRSRLEEQFAGPTPSVAAGLGLGQATACSAAAM